MSNASLHESFTPTNPSSPGGTHAAELLHPSSPGAIERGDLHARNLKKKGTSQKQTKRTSTSSLSPSPPAVQNHNALIKYGSLLLLVGQMVGLVLLMRYSRTHVDGELYLASTAVFMMEVRLDIFMLYSHRLSLFASMPMGCRLKPLFDPLETTYIRS